MLYNKKKSIIGYKNIINKIYENSPEQLKKFFFQEKIEISNRESLVRNIQNFLFKK